MNIQDAINSGKPFKRKNWRRYRIMQTVNSRMVIRIYEYPAYIGSTPSVKIEDILSNDWIVRQD